MELTSKTTQEIDENREKEDLNRVLMTASLFGALYLWAFNIFYSPGFLIFAMSFIVTGIFLATLINRGKVKLFEFSFLTSPKISFAYVLVLVLLMIGSVFGFYTLFQKTYAEYSYTQGVEILNSGGSIDGVERLMLRATRFDSHDKYLRSLAEIGIAKTQIVLTDTETSTEVRGVEFQNTFGTSIA